MLVLDALYRLTAAAVMLLAIVTGPPSIVRLVLPKLRLAAVVIAAGVVL